jgi:hypothetical protein
MHPSTANSTPVQLQVSSSSRSRRSCGKRWRASSYVVVDRPKSATFRPLLRACCCPRAPAQAMELGLSGPGIKLFSKAIHSLAKVGALQCLFRATRLALLAHRARALRLHQLLSSRIRRGAGSEVLVEAIAGDAVRAPSPRRTTRNRCAPATRWRCAVALLRADACAAARCRSLFCAPSTRRARRIWPCACAPTASTPSACATWCRPPSTPRCAWPEVCAACCCRLPLR